MDEIDRQNMIAELDHEEKVLKDKMCSGSLRQDDQLDFSDLIGSVILDIGFHPAADEGGLTIDYEKDGVKNRIVLGFTELGMWKYFQGLLK